MNFADIENMWRSPLNRPALEQIEKDKMQFATELRRRHRGFVIFLTWIFTVLTLLTGRLVLHALENQSTAEGFVFFSRVGCDCAAGSPVDCRPLFCVAVPASPVRARERRIIDPRNTPGAPGRNPAGPGATQDRRGLARRITGRAADRCRSIARGRKSGRRNFAAGLCHLAVDRVRDRTRTLAL